MAAAADSASRRRLMGPAIVALVVLAADQLTKLWAVASLVPREPIEVVGSFVQFTLVYNRGGAMGTNFGSTAYYLISSILILGFVLYYLHANRHLSRVSYPLALIAAGAVGNIIDRIRIGEVIDFIDVDIPDVSLFGYTLERWWTFNVADAAISLSIVYLLVSLLFSHRAHSEDPAVAPGERRNPEIQSS